MRKAKHHFFAKCLGTGMPIIMAVMLHDSRRLHPDSLYPRGSVCTWITVWLPELDKTEVLPGMQLKF